VIGELINDFLHCALSFPEHVRSGRYKEKARAQVESPTRGLRAFTAPRSPMSIHSLSSQPATTVASDELHP
jgi:hypothetical protein